MDLPCPETGKFLCNFARRSRSAENISLHFHAAERLQRITLLLGLHPLGGRHHIEALGKTSDGVHDRDRLFAVGDIWTNDDQS